MEGPKKALPLYVGVFASDPKGAAKTVRAVCKEAILDVLKTVKPEGYLAEEQNYLPKDEPTHQLETILNEAQIEAIEKDYASFEDYTPPKDNYHMTCLFIGMKKSKLRKVDLQILDNWKDGVQQKISTDFIAYIPNYLLAGSVREVGKVQVSNKCPHMTLLLKGKASAVESNSLLELIFERAPVLFKNRSKRVIILDIPYGKVSKSVILINTAFQFEGITGNNCTHGKK